jgi:phosphoribosyl-AMP cyclohydrolase
MSFEPLPDVDSFVAAVSFGSGGLVPVIAQQWDSHEVLMMAWMDESALRETIATGCATYFSRSRESRWVKGETSGHVQSVKDIRIDCDGDTLLLMVDQTGAACHTGDRTCFDHEGAR